MASSGGGGEREREKVKGEKKETNRVRVSEPRVERKRHIETRRG